MLFYKLTNKRYEFYQKIRENSIFHLIYTINSIHELKNNNLISCNSSGLNIYSKEKNKYNLIEKHSLKEYFFNLIELNNNKLILMQLELKKIFSKRSFF